MIRIRIRIKVISQIRIRIRIRNTDSSYSIESLYGLQSTHVHFYRKHHRDSDVKYFIGPQALFMVP
jgi:hypothetical protein